MKFQYHCACCQKVVFESVRVDVVYCSPGCRESME